MPPLPSAIQAQQTRAQLKKKLEQFDALKSRLERKSLSADTNASASSSFQLESFREQAAAALGADWVALDYCLTDTEITVVIVTPLECTVQALPVSQRFTMALAACAHARRKAEPPLPKDLEILGSLLIPNELAERLSPDTHLLIAPHRGLHQVPWAALQPTFAPQPLVCLCTPSTVPSLHSLGLLWERGHPAQGQDRTRGLLVGLSAFDGLHPDLPHVKNEIAALTSKLGAQGRSLCEEAATWANLSKLDLAELVWLHIASHFSADRHTGRLSGLVLKDGEVWLDQLRDLAPLPSLISLSACNSNDSFLYEGDERVDLQTTCLIAGAQSVLGSAWPILDDSAAELTTIFFDYYLGGMNPAQAAAAAQRQLINAGRELGAWASFICAGVP